MSSSSGGSESTASMREGAAEAIPNMDPNASLPNGGEHHHEEEPSEEDSVAVQETKEEEEEEEEEDDAAEIVPEITHHIQQSTDNRMASVITINGTEAGRDPEVAYAETNNAKVSGRTERSGFDNPGFVEDEAHGKGSGSAGRVVNGGGRLSPPSSPPPRPPSPAGPFLNSLVATTPTPSGGVNGRGPIMETSNSNIHNNSGLIMTPNEKEKSDIDGCTNVTEAVNLELVNMNPYGGAGLGIGDEVAGGKSGTNGGLNGIPVKRGAGDEETGDGGFGDPYDEYFVPVNEHRKYMRGEKLYVTKDRRRSQSWKRCICWGVGFTILAIAILIAVLAGTGVILSQEEKVAESRSFGDDHIPHVAQSRDPNAPLDKDPVPTALPPEPSSSFTPPPSMSSVPVAPPTTEMSSLNVPRVLEADIRIDNLKYTPDLENTNSSRFKEIASMMEEELKLALFDHQTLKNGPADIFVNVVGFSPGSVVTKFHVGWRFKDSFPVAHNPIDVDSLKDRLEAYILNHGEYLYTYHVASGSVRSSHVMDQCQIDNGGCSHECRYDYEEAKFMCNCPPGLFLDQTGKKCSTELMDDITTTTSTKGPMFDNSPWMPIQPSEPTLVSEEAGHDAPTEGARSDEDMHKEMEDHNETYHDHHDHFQPMHPVNSEDYGHHQPVEPSVDDYDSSNEEHKMETSINEEGHKDSEMHKDSKPVEEHHDEHRLISSVGTGRSSGDDVMHSSEEHREEYDAENDTEHDQDSLTGHSDEKQVNEGEKSEEDGRNFPLSKEEMENLGHAVDSSENTSEEAHDSVELPDSHEEPKKDEIVVSHEMSGGEVSDGSNEYHPSSHSFSNELHGPVSEPATSENPNWNGLESHESSSHDGSAADGHIDASSTSAPDAHETLNESGHHDDNWPLKGEIISAVEHVIVKDENETMESVNEGHSDVMDHNLESGASGENANDSSHDVEVVAHVAMEGEVTDDNGGDMAVPTEAGMVEHHEEVMSEHNEGIISEHGEDKMVEHKDDGMMESHDMEMEHEEDEMPQGQGDNMEHDVMMVKPGEEEGHEVTETKEEEMATHGEAPEDHEVGVRIGGEMEEATPHDSSDNVISELKGEHEESHVPVVVVTHGENDVGNHEVNPKLVEEHKVMEVPVDEETGRGMDEPGEKMEEKSPEEVMVHSIETVLGTNSHEMDLTSMNHEKPAAESDNIEENEHMNQDLGIPIVMMEHPISEEGVTVMESSTAAAGENEADVANEKQAERDQVGLWDMNHEVKEMDEHVHSTEAEGAPDKEHNESEAPVVGLEVVAKDNEENMMTMIPEEKVKEMEEKEVLVDHSMEKPSTEEEISTERMEHPETTSVHVDNLANVLEGNEEVGEKKVVDEMAKVDSEAIAPEEEIHKSKSHEVDGMLTAIPDREILNEDEDPNIVPVEETPKETTVDDLDANKMSISPAIEMKIVGLEENKEVATGEKNDTEPPAMEEDNMDTSGINLTSISDVSTESKSEENVSKMPMDHEMEIGMSSSTTSPSENSIEILSDQFNSTDGANIPPATENEQIEHLVVPIAVMNESSMVMTTPSQKENNIDDPPLHLQAGIPLTVSDEPEVISTSTSGRLVLNDLLLPWHREFLENPDNFKNESNSEKVPESSSTEKVADEMEAKPKDESVNLRFLDDDTSAEKAQEKEDMMNGEKVEEKDVGKTMDGDSKEEVSSITTIHQDFTEEHANTVHAINPTSPSTIIEETPKEEAISDPSVPKSHENSHLETTVAKDENYSPQPHLPYESDDNERSNNLATLDNEDSLAIPEGGNEAVVKVGAVDARQKSTTEHTNEILAVPIYRESWPATALEANNLTKMQKDPETTSEGHQIESSILKEKEEVTKMDPFEVPMKKKGEFKKTIHHEDEITKPLFVKEGKESLNKLDKIGLLPSLPIKDDSSEEMNSEEDDGITTTDMPSISQQNVEISSSTEAVVIPSTVAADKGGEKLNAIGEDESGIKKDFAKALVKENVKDAQDSVTDKLETTEKDGDQEKEENMTEKLNETESTTQLMAGNKVNATDAMDEHKKEMEMKEEMMTEAPESDKASETIGIHPTEMVMKEEETTTVVADESDSSPVKDDNLETAKEMDAVVTVKEGAMTENEEATTMMRVAEEALIPTSTEAAQEKVEELLKEMGGYGEGGHKVVPKSGVELNVHKEIHEDLTTTEKIDAVESSSTTSSVVMVSSSTSSLIPSSSMAEPEKQPPTTLPPENETVKVEVNNKVEEKATSEETAHEQMHDSKSENATSEEPIPTMMIHEIVPSISLSSTESSSVEPSSSTESSSVVSSNSIFTSVEPSSSTESSSIEPSSSTESSSVEPSSSTESSSLEPSSSTESSSVEPSSSTESSSVEPSSSTESSSIEPSSSTESSSVQPSSSTESSSVEPSSSTESSSVEPSSSTSSSVEPSSSTESLSVEPSSSTESSVVSEVSFSKGIEVTTIAEVVPKMTTMNIMPEAVVTTSSPDSAGVTMPPHVSEVLVKDETSSFAKKEVAAMNTTESSVESNKTEEVVTEKLIVEEVHSTPNVTTSTLPEIDHQYFSKCTAGQFQCTNGTSLMPYSVTPISSSYVASLATGVACVPLSAKCDSINDCSDGSDELGCIEEGCPGNFQCSNGQCLKRHLVCNGIVDCNDGSDEASCEKWQCQFDEFQCPSGRCIPVLWLCDGKPDCDNHTDEYSCQDSCGNNEYLCPERWCIPMSWRCNGVPECANGEDEKLCDCSLEQVKCGTGGCVARTEICDGVEQCPDQSDEWGCVRLHNETMKLEVRTTENEWLSVCADNWDNNWSNFVCQSFGYSRAVFTEYPSAGDLGGSSDMFILKPGASVTSPPGNSMRLPGVLQRASSSLCSSGSIVEISCQEFTCGNHGLADGVAARLVGGDEAANGQWPSVALLYHTRQRATCTASIISPRWLIASYNCLHMREKSLSPDGWVAFGGGSTFDKDKPETQIRSVRAIVPYPQVKYNRFLYNHDVALVELIEPLIFTRSVGAICLPEKAIEPRQLCVTAGWGYTSPGEINFSQYLHYLPVPTIDLNECNSTKHYSGFITEDKICAGFTDAMHSPCYNDEGAPLMCVSEGGIWELQGVLSYHSNCGRGYHPSIFSSVTAVRDWVKRVVGGKFERRSTFNVRRRRRRTKRRRRSSINAEMTSIVWT